jgi:hypothetical protein
MNWWKVIELSNTWYILRWGWTPSVFVGKSATVFKQLAGEDTIVQQIHNMNQYQLFRSHHTDKGLHWEACVRWLKQLQNCAPRWTKVEGPFLLNVVIRECAPILELLPSEDKSLLIGSVVGRILPFRHLVFPNGNCLRAWAELGKIPSGQNGVRSQLYSC